MRRLTWSQRALEVGQRAGLVHPRVHQHDAVARRERPGVAVRDAGPRERQAQAPDARQHALAAAELARLRSGSRARHDSGNLERPYGDPDHQRHDRGSTRATWPP